MTKQNVTSGNTSHDQVAASATVSNGNQAALVPSGNTSHDQSLMAVDPDGNYLQPNIKDEFHRGATDFITGLVVDDSFASKANIYNYLNNNDGAISDICDKQQTLEIVNFLIYPVQVMTQEGYLVPAKRTVLVTKDGQSYGSVAEGVFKSMQGLVQFFGFAPWADGITVRPVRRKTRSGFYILQLEVVSK